MSRRILGNIISFIIALLSIFGVLLSYSWALNLLWFFIIIIDLLMLVGIFAGWNDKAYMLDIYYSRGEAKGKYSDPITIFYYIVLLLLYVAKGMWGLTIFWIINICLVVIAVGHSKDVVEEEIDNLENIS